MCFLESRLVLISLHVLSRAVAHECPFKKLDKLSMRILRLKKSYNWSKRTLSAIFEINRGYYTVARRYEFYVRVARTISHE